MFASETAGKLPISERRWDLRRESLKSLLLCGTFALGSAAVLPQSALSQTTAQAAPSQKTQTQTAPAQQPPARAHHGKKPTAVAAAEPPPPAPPTVAPSLFQQPPAPATVTAGNNELTVKADNSSLAQILHQVSSQTGMKLDGLGGDERVFGSFGPGAPREVLTALLNGTSYNILMVGDLPNGAPRELLLTSRASAGGSAPPNANPAQAHNPDEDNPDENGNPDDSSSDEAPPMQYTPPSIAPSTPPQRATPQMRNMPSPPQE